ncbi:MAG TPA: NAD(P)H-dependent oxidoreductase subunit E [Soehngenia sp.]|nr:NAD(P)H-dependent oxidoreductase subunit E [Soehngenia sp.]HPP32012.1 NAD(P)H-dependent oxidoreductase subunit E [Soehngenia sp.]
MDYIFDLEKNRDKLIEYKNFLTSIKDTEGALMPALQKAQELFNYLSKEVLKIVSDELKIPLAEIYGVATFYSQFSFIPKGENQISVCLGTACYVKGAQVILEEFEKELGIKQGETTSDLKFSIGQARCLGDCSKAPVVMINSDIFPLVKKNDVKKILDNYR